MATLRNKEMSAVTFNLKQQRVLEKSMQTLNLEQTYAMKLLELDNRIIKVHYKKLKERVSRIKSFLPPEDITKFRNLELRGKLKPAIGTFTSSGAIKIAAASRRLNLGRGLDNKKKRVRSAIPRINVTAEDDRHNVHNGLERSDSKTPTKPGKLRRSNSVTGVFVDAPELEVSLRPGSASIAVNNNSRKKNDNSNLIPVSQRPSTVSPARFNDRQNQLANGERHRPTTSVKYRNNDTNLVLDPDSDSEEIVLPTTPEIDYHKVRPSTTPHHKQTHSPFSSHVTAEKDAKSSCEPLSSQSHSHFARRLSHVSNDSIDSHLGENLFEERRQELLEEENARALTLDKRTQMFLRDVDEYLLKNPPLQASHIAFENSPRQLPRKDSFEQSLLAEREPRGERKSKHVLRRRKNDYPLEENRVGSAFSPEVEYKEKLLNLWKDLNKCRYLRVPDDRIDLSGMNTLVKDHMRLFDTLRNAETSPIIEIND